MTADVPLSVDHRDPETARTWTLEADVKRPWRADVRAAIAALVRESGARRVLELGSGPGQLAEAVLAVCDLDRYTLFDFSPAMHELARGRVSHPAARFVVGDFKQPAWTAGLDPVDAIVSMQAVHEIRHKHHVPGLYRDAREVLATGGRLVICDHVPFDDSERATSLHLTVDEQYAAMTAAGLVDVTTALLLRGLYVCTALAPASS